MQAQAEGVTRTPGHPPLPADARPRPPSAQAASQPPRARPSTMKAPMFPQTRSRTAALVVAACVAAAGLTARHVNRRAKRWHRRDPRRTRRQPSQPEHSPAERRPGWPRAGLEPGPGRGIAEPEGAFAARCACPGAASGTPLSSGWPRAGGREPRLARGCDEARRRSTVPASLANIPPEQAQAMLAELSRANLIAEQAIEAAKTAIHHAGRPCACPRRSPVPDVVRTSSPATRPAPVSNAARAVRAGIPGLPDRPA